MTYPGNLLELSTTYILEHYKGTGFRPNSVSSMNSMLKDQYVQLKEMLAFWEDLERRGIIKDEEGKQAILNAISGLEVYIVRIRKYTTRTTE